DPGLARDLHRLRPVDRAAVALDRAADLVARDADVRHEVHGDALRLHLLLAPGRRLPRGVARRRALRDLWQLQPRLVALGRAWPSLRRDQPADRGAPGRAPGPR